jgi:hypothetical protein
MSLSAAALEIALSAAPMIETIVSVGKSCRCCMSVVKVGVARAREDVYFGKAAFINKGGEYDWSEEDESGCGAKGSPVLQW